MLQAHLHTPGFVGRVQAVVLRVAVSLGLYRSKSVRVIVASPMVVGVVLLLAVTSTNRVPKLPAVTSAAVTAMVKLHCRLSPMVPAAASVNGLLTAVVPTV